MCASCKLIKAEWCLHSPQSLDKCSKMKEPKDTWCHKSKFFLNINWFHIICFVFILQLNVYRRPFIKVMPTHTILNCLMLTIKAFYAGCITMELWYLLECTIWPLALCLCAFQCVSMSGICVCVSFSVPV